MAFQPNQAPDARPLAPEYLSRHSLNQCSIVSIRSMTVDALRHCPFLQHVLFGRHLGAARVVYDTPHRNLPPAEKREFVDFNAVMKVLRSALVLH